jgi:hypothetical protein
MRAGAHSATLHEHWFHHFQLPHVLLTHLHWWQAYYHFVRPHESLRVVLAQPNDRGGKCVPQRYRQRTPAMAVGLTGRRWSVREVLALPLAPTPIGAG